MGNLGESQVVCLENFFDKMKENKVQLACQSGVMNSIGAIGINKRGSDKCLIQNRKNENYVEFDPICSSYIENFTDSKFSKMVSQYFNSVCKNKPKCEMMLDF